MQYNTNDFPLTIGDDPVSDLKIMQSAAGYYIGRSYWDNEFGFEGPYSRETDYMTEAAALNVLASIKASEDWPVRDCVENKHAYATGSLPDPN